MSTKADVRRPSKFIGHILVCCALEFSERGKQLEPSIAPVFPPKFEKALNVNMTIAQIAINQTASGASEDLSRITTSVEYAKGNEVGMDKILFA